jgi:hypothetical protein
VTPCVCFWELFEQSFDRLSDLPHGRYDGYSVDRDAPGQPFVAPPPADEPGKITALSQSTLKRLANCPREEYFTRLVETPTADHMARGTVVHEAAELILWLSPWGRSTPPATRTPRPGRFGASSGPAGRSFRP